MEGSRELWIALSITEMSGGEEARGGLGCEEANEAATKCELSGEDGGDVCGAKINPSGT